MNRLARYAGLVIGASAIAFWFLSTPRVDRVDLPKGDAAEGEAIANAMGCVNCHGENLAGGLALGSPFGVFHVPNITQAAIGDWTDSDIFNALTNGVAPDGRHYYPVFPYRNYHQLADDDLADLVAYLRTVPSVDRDNIPHELSLIAAWRRPVGIWKRLAGDYPAIDPENRGQYLAEAMSHCQECHTPRNVLGITQNAEAYEGGVLYGADGAVKTTVPSLRNGDSALWSRDELHNYLTTGFTPDYDTASGEMVDVIENIAKLSAEDQEAITDYVFSLRASPLN